MGEGEPSDVDRVAISFRDLAGGLFRLFLTGVSFLAWLAWSQLTGDIQEVQQGIKSVRADLVAQNTRITVIEHTTQRTADLVEAEDQRGRGFADRLARVESCCKK